MDFVAVDIGASNTRYTQNNGKISVLPNNMVTIEESTRVDLEPYGEDIEDAIDVTIECDKQSEYFPVRVLMGSMATRYSSSQKRPSGLLNKHKQQVNYISTIVAAAISKYKNGLSDELPLYLALPPLEVATAKDYVKEQLLGNFRVTFHKFGGLQVDLSISDVTCYEESFLAILSYFFEMNGAPKETARKYAVGNVLSLDIGASTTDIAVVSNLKYLEKSGQTYRIGGDVALDILADGLRSKYGYDAPHDQLELAMAEGRIQMGNMYEDISDMVRIAKSKFAEQIMEIIQVYFRKVGIPIQSIRAIVTSGGGSMRSEYMNDDSDLVVTSEPMSHYITGELNKVCPGVEVEHHANNPRLANMIGLFIRASLDIKRREQVSAG